MPTNIVAGLFRFEPREFFEVEEPRARGATRRSSDGPAAPPPAALADRSRSCRPPRPASRRRRRGPRWPRRRRARAARRRASVLPPDADVPSRSRRTAPSSSTRRSRSTAPSPAPTATSRSARASRSTGSPCRRERRRATRPGASAELGSIGAPDTFGTTPSTAGADRLALPRARASRAVHGLYRLSGLAVAYDDVVDVNLKVWGTNVAGAARRLTLDRHAPAPAPLGPSLPGLGPPGLGARDVDARRRTQANLRAVDVPPHQFVELRVGLPASPAHARPRARRSSRRRRRWRRSSPRRRPTAAALERDQQKIDDAKRPPRRARS